jgi:hypothetical protein
MSPSIGNPHGISADSPLLLERALTSLWRDEAVKSAPARAKEPIASAKRRVGSRDCYAMWPATGPHLCTIS